MPQWASHQLLNKLHLGDNAEFTRIGTFSTFILYIITIGYSIKSNELSAEIPAIHNINEKQDKSAG